MDIIFLRELKVETLIGVYDWERLVPQTLQMLNQEQSVNYSPSLSARIAFTVLIARLLLPAKSRTFSKVPTFSVENKIIAVTANTTDVRPVPRVLMA